MIRRNNKRVLQIQANETHTSCVSLVDWIRSKKLKKNRTTNFPSYRLKRIWDQPTEVLVEIFKWMTRPCSSTQSVSHSVLVNQVECLKHLVVDQGAELMELKHKISCILKFLGAAENVDEFETMITCFQCST